MRLRRTHWTGREAPMKSLYVSLLAAATFFGCSRSSTQSPAVSDQIHRALNQAQFSNVSVSQDRDKGVVTLGGHVLTEADKAQAESIARTAAAGQVVANEIAVRPAGFEQEA